MILPSLKRIRTEDFDSSFNGLISKLAFPINSMFQSILDALNKNLTFADNFASTVSTITVSVDANGVPKNNAIIVLDSSQNGKNVIGLLILDIVGENGALPTSGVFITKAQSSNQLSLTNIKGLPPNINFTITLVAFT